MEESNQTIPSVREFYKAESILITGGNGFIGRILIFKLLKSCPDIKHIYAILRSSRKKTAHQKMQQLIDNEIYASVPSVKNKLVLVIGDLNKPGLGISEDDRKMLTDNVSIVFHCAASVKATESLSHILKTNTLASRTLFNLCTEMKHIKKVVHVSTAFIGGLPGQTALAEKIQQSPFESIDEVLDRIDDHAYIDDIQNNLVPSKWLNTYFLSKFLVEILVQKYSTRLPLVIVRPSIVSSSWKEPHPGWAHGISFLNVALSSLGIGTIRAILCSPESTADLVPIDYVVSSLIVAAWHSTYFRKSSDVPVYNCTTSDSNKIKWKHVIQLVEKYFREMPTNSMKFYPSCFTTNSKIRYTLTQSTFLILRAAVSDLFFGFLGSGQMLVKEIMRLNGFLSASHEVTLRQWDFESDNQRTMALEMDQEEREIFNTDLESMDWNRYFIDYVPGLCKYILRDSGKSEKSKSKLNRLCWADKGYLVFVGTIVATMSYYLSTFDRKL